MRLLVVLLVMFVVLPMPVAFADQEATTNELPAHFLNKKVKLPSTGDLWDITAVVACRDDHKDATGCVPVVVDQSTNGKRWNVRCEGGGLPRR